jgi:branched-chain amino acid transport system ATP-binding protein
MSELTPPADADRPAVPPADRAAEPPVGPAADAPAAMVDGAPRPDRRPVKRQGPSGKEAAQMLLAETPSGGAFPDGSAQPGRLGGASAFPLAVLFGLAMVETMDRATGQVLLPEIRDAFSLTNTSVLAIYSVAAFVSLVLTVPIAVLTDRGHRVRIMLTGAAIFAGFSIGTAIIPTAWLLFLIMRAGAGVGQATVFPTHNSLLADYYDVPYRPIVYSVHRAAEGLGIFLGFLLAGWLGQTYGWRAPYFVFALPCFVLIVIGLKLKEPTRGHFERKAMGVSDEVAELEEPAPSFEESFRMVQRIQSLRRVYAAIPFFAVAFIGFGSLANLLYEQEFQLGAAQRGLYDAIAELGQIVGLAFSAYLGTRLVRRDPALIVRFVSLIAMVSAVLAAGFALAPNVATAVLFRIALASALAAVLPSVFAVLSLAIPARARAAGFSLAALYVIPGLVVLPFIGWVSDTFGIRTGMLMMVPIFVVGGIIVSTAHKMLDSDIRNVWTATAARSELLNERRKGNIKQLLVRDLDVRYGDVQILFGVDFEIDQGEIVALLGTNGAGKSTLLKAITGVVQASNGAIVFDGRDITDAPPHEIAALGIAMVPGGQGVFPALTVAENIRVASWTERRRARHDPTVDVAAKVEQILDTFPVLRQRLEEPAANLSGGQQQMLAIGMAFLIEPKLLVIDELSLGLAPVIVEQLLAIVRAIRDQGTTIILVEQSVNVALTLAETAYFMEKGEIRFHGPTAELLERPDVLRSVFLEGAQKGLEVISGAASVEAEPAAVPVDDTRVTAGDVVDQVVPDVVADAATAGLVAATGPDDAGPMLEIEGLSVRFGGIRAVDDVSLSVAPGEIVGLIGPNGAGKTTLFDLISGFTAADAGRVRIAGRDVTGLTPDARARGGLGRSFQDARLFPALTVEDTIAVALERFVQVRDPFNAALRLPAQQDCEFEVAARVDELIELMGIESFRSKFVHELSTGSRRVVDLACVLAHRPAVVLLDEPSSGIAQREAEALGPLIRRIRDTLGACVLLIEHDMPLVTGVSDRLVALEQGHIVTMGTADEVLNHPQVVASYLGTTTEVISRSGARTKS